MAEEKAVTYSGEGSVGVITLDKPPVNSYDMAFFLDLRAAIEETSADDGVVAVLIRSASENFFSAGADVKAFAANDTSANMEMIQLAHEVLSSMREEASKIFIAVIDGHALGGGLEIALACDLRFAGDGEFKIGLPEVTLGLLPGNGGTVRLPLHIGYDRALDLMITGKPVTPQEAYELGIVTRIYPSQSLWEDARAYAQNLGDGAALAISWIKYASWSGLGQDIGAALSRERTLIGKLLDSRDGREGIAAFVEKRAPAFTGE